MSGGGGASVTVGVGGSANEACAAAEAAQSSYGCEFWAVKPDLPFPFDEHRAYCFAIVVANTWSSAAHLEVSYAGARYADPSFIRIPQGKGQAISYAPYDPAAGLGAGEVAIVFLSHGAGGWVDCPVAPALDGEWGAYGTGRAQAFVIETDRPVAAHSIFPYGSKPGFGDTSASMLLPAGTWDTSYLALNPYEKGHYFEEADPSIAILAREHGTEVTLLPKVAIEGGPGIAPAPANAPVTYAIGAGEYLQLSQAAELTGSVIQANKPIGVWGTQSGLLVPASTATAWDEEHQQIPPVRAWGSRYAAVRYRNRSTASSEEAPPWRLVGAVDGTELSWTPSTPPGAPLTLAQGQLAEFFASGPFVVESQDEDHPFYLAQYMTSCGYVEEPPLILEGDPEWVHVVPTEQYLERYVFFTEPSYPETNLVVVRKRSPETQEFADVTLDCAGALGGWQPLGDFEYTRVDLVTGNFEPVGGCDNGRHEMTSAAPFAVTVWGWASAVSYGYPAGAGVAPINDVEVPPTPR